MDIKKEIGKKLKQYLNEHLLTEKLTNIDDDVNSLYIKYFEYDINKIEETGMITNDMFLTSEIDTSGLKSEDCLKSHNLNPCTIKVNKGSNFYQPSTNTIGISVNNQAVNFVMNEANGDLEKAISLLDINTTLRQEFTEEKIKGSIHHELVHWIDDTMNNKHITKRINKAMELGIKDINNINNIPVNSTKMEIQGQIHNIKQLYNKYKDIWDDLTFKEMLDKSPALNSIYRVLPNDFKNKWIRDLKTRMYRENLLGKNMNS